MAEDLINRMIKHIENSFSKAERYESNLDKSEKSLFV